MSYGQTREEERKDNALDRAVAWRIARRIIASVATVVLTIVPLSMWGCPRYQVWQQGMAGTAELTRANQNRQIKIAEAEAFRDAAVLYAEAEVARAHGVAESNDIIAERLGGPEAYLRYLWIQQLETAKATIYIPTEANLPIMEATRLLKK